MNEFNLSLPAELKPLLEGGCWTPNRTGHSESLVYRIAASGHGGRYLKIADSGWSTSLFPEWSALNWLKGRLPVPEPLFFGREAGRDYLLMSEIEGRDASVPASLMEPGKTVRALAEGLVRIHSLETAGCPLDVRLDRKLAEAGKRVTEGLVDEDDFEPDYARRSAADLLEELKSGRPGSEDLVFTHGDYCLPNVIVADGKAAGFLDWGRGGLADRCQDIALAVRSIRHNLGEERWVELFLDVYGMRQPDRDKLRYYILLDELF